MHPPRAGSLRSTAHSRARQTTRPHSEAAGPLPALSAVPAGRGCSSGGFPPHDDSDTRDLSRDGARRTKRGRGAGRTAPTNGYPASPVVANHCAVIEAVTLDYAGGLIRPTVQVPVMPLEVVQVPPPWARERV